MCTVTFIPVKKGVIITHNRDEKISRQPSELPKKINYKGKTLWFPKDKEKNGTWFCVDNKGRVACILNGAFKKHVSNPPYAKSRGIIVLESFLATTFKDWIESCDLFQIEPFTLILYENKDSLFEVRWDGNKKHIKKLSSSENHIWSSVTLYSTSAKEKRENWLKTWLDEQPTTAQSLLNFHNYGGESERHTSLKMEILGTHKTVSITQFFNNGIDRFIDHQNFSTLENSKTNF